MDDEMVDVLIVLGLLGIGVLAGIVLLFKYTGGFVKVKEYIQRKRSNEMPEQRIRKRTTIRIHPSKENRQPIVCKPKASRVLSAPPCSEIPHAPSHPLQSPNFTPAVFIIPEVNGKAYKAADAKSVMSAKGTTSTASSYLPRQMDPLGSRRTSL